jgi:hypothetical protein
MRFRQRQCLRQGYMVVPQGARFEPMLHLLVIVTLHLLGP